MSADQLTPHLIVDGAAAAIEFYKRAFGATELYRLAEPSGRIGHAELRVEGALLALADEYPEHGHVGPARLGGSGCSLSLQVADVDAVVARAIEAGATAERPITDEFYGDRVGWLRDPFGHRWSVRTAREQLTTETIKQRFDAMIRSGNG
jgi:PhnB protein